MTAYLAVGLVFVGIVLRLGIDYVRTETALPHNDSTDTAFLSFMLLIVAGMALAFWPAYIAGWFIYRSVRPA